MIVLQAEDLTSGTTLALLFFVFERYNTNFNQFC